MQYLKLSVLLFIIVSYFSENCECKSLAQLPTGIRSDVIVTSGFKIDKKNEDLSENKPEEPGWMRRQLLKFGQMTSAVGSKLGGFSQRITSVLDKVCEVVKTIIPVIAAVCHVGDFQFCSSMNEAPQELATAFSSNNFDFDALD